MYYKSQGSRNRWYIISLGMLRDPLHVNLSGEFRQKSLCLPPPPPKGQLTLLLTDTLKIIDNVTYVGKKIIYNTIKTNIILDG